MILTKVRTPAHAQRTEASWSLRLCLTLFTLRPKHPPSGPPRVSRTIWTGFTGASWEPGLWASLWAAPSSRESVSSDTPSSASLASWAPPGQRQKRVGHSRPSHPQHAAVLPPVGAGRTAGRGCLGIAVELTRCFVDTFLPLSSSDLTLSSQNFSAALVVLQRASQSVDRTYSLPPRAVHHGKDGQLIYSSDIFSVPLLQDDVDGCRSTNSTFQ